MGMTTKERRNLASRTCNKMSSLEKAVSEELLKMGMSYKYIGTYYLKDAIIFAIKEPKGTYQTVRELVGRAFAMVANKYNLTRQQVPVQIRISIEGAFTYGNIDYLLDVFKGSYDFEKGRVSNAAFIMTIAEKVKQEIDESQSFNTTQLRILIQGGVENITDAIALESLYGIVRSLEGGVIA